MLEVSRGIEGLAARAQLLESDGQQLDMKLKDKAKTADKIDDLFNRIRPHQSGGASMSQGRDPLADVLAGMPKDLFPETSDLGKEQTRKSSGRS